MNTDPTATAALDECIDLARRMGLRPKSNARYAHICALCKHSSSGHLSHDGGSVYSCPCGCEITDNPGFWLSERDFKVWEGAFPVVVKLR